MIYTILFVFGFIGLLVMAIMGSLQTGHHGLGGHGSHGPLHSHGHAPAQGPHGHAPAMHGHTAHVHGAGHHHGMQDAAARGGAWLLRALSPIDALAMAVGAGALGIVGRKVFHDETVAAGMAVAGAIFMDFAIVRPLFAMIFRFATSPSSGLEGMISETAEAATSFDAEGRGLIKLTLDGQTSQVLATLERGELEQGVHVSKGDRLVVLEVDPSRNVCRVSREIATL